MIHQAPVAEKVAQTPVVKPRTSKIGKNGSGPKGDGSVNQTKSSAVPPASELDTTGPVVLKRRNLRSWSPVAGNTAPLAKKTHEPTKKTLTVAGTVNPAAVIANGVPSPLTGRTAARTLVSRLGDAGSGLKRSSTFSSPASDHSCLRCSALSSSNRRLSLPPTARSRW